MPEPDVMSLEETVTKSLLDKPLHQLTEDDISQLTREDCRRYLKEKGMRRPSWNKSQAIQQVISLKTLLETTPDSDAAGARKKLYVPRLQISHRAPKETNADAKMTVSDEHSIIPRGRDPAIPDPSCDSSSRLVAADSDPVPPRTTGAANESFGQMTIFYCGKVNVYDDVPSDKAYAIMQVAASPLYSPQEAPCNGTVTLQSIQGHLQSVSVKEGPASPVMIMPTPQTVKMIDNPQLQREESNTFREDNMATEGPGSRKASVQRYLEKRKDRFKSKRKVGMPSSTNLDFYLNHQMGNQTPNEQHSSRSDTCSPPQIGPPNTPSRCSSAENTNITANANPCTDLAGKDIQD